MFPASSASMGEVVCGFAVRCALGVDVGVGGIFLDEFATRTYIFAHEHGENVVGIGSILDGDLLEQTCLGVHGGVPKLFWIHFTETFVT